MHSFFGPDFFTNNRDRLRAALGSDMPIVISGNGTMQRGGDDSFPFHQDSSFWYVTGLTVPDLVLVIGSQDTYLIAPTLSFEREAFDGAHNYADFSAKSGITQIFDARTGWQKLREELVASHDVATLLSLPAHMKRHGIYTLPFRRRLIARLKRTDPQVRIHDARSELARLRCIKQPEELKALQQAIDITIKTIADIRKPAFLDSIRHEYEIEALISHGFRSRGAKGTAFFSVVGAGPHSTTLHHYDNDGPVKSGDLVVIDIGADYEHYAADITRTICRGKPTERQQQLHDAVRDTQDYAISLIKPGVMPIDYETQVEAYIGQRLIELGIIREAKREHIRRYFPHATSHFLGLDTHDAGDYRAAWEPGMVITCEPGIYLPEEGIGVRIEDDILITETGCKVLSSACPRELTSVQ